MKNFLEKIIGTLKSAAKTFLSSLIFSLIIYTVIIVITNIGTGYNNSPLIKLWLDSFYILVVMVISIWLILFLENKDK
jgi:hypothetical protein